MAIDQGLVFFLPNMTWLQPPAYVHQMISNTWFPQAVSVLQNGQYLGKLSLPKGRKPVSEADRQLRGAHYGI
jgi:hypothetical protein